jgi:hypothetical protein
MMLENGRLFNKEKKMNSREIEVEGLCFLVTTTI